MRTTALIVYIFVVLIPLGCKKAPDAFVEVIVTDSLGLAIQGANVALMGQSSDSVYSNQISRYELSGTTNASGVAIFRFTEFYQQGPDGFAILKVDVNAGSRSGSGLVKLVEAETSSITIIAQ